MLFLYLVCFFFAWKWLVAITLLLWLWGVVFLFWFVPFAVSGCGWMLNESLAAWRYVVFALSVVNAC